MTAVVIDASAGVELVADTVRGRQLRSLLPADAVPWVPDVFYVECGAVLRRWDLRSLLSPPLMAEAVDALRSWPLRIVQSRGLFADAWRRRASLTFADGIYVALAARLSAPLLTDDHRLARAPDLPISILQLPR